MRAGSILIIILTLVLTTFGVGQEPVAAAKKPPKTNPEAEYYAVDYLTPPTGEVLEVGGMGLLSDGRLVVSTRRGRVWIIDNAIAADPEQARFTMFAEGLHEGLGLEVIDDVIHVVQRGEISRLVDRDGDGRAERIETVSNDWGMTGNYHEFAYGLPRDPQGNLYVALNLGFWNPKWWHGKAKARGRGWVLQIQPDGSSIPFATGFRSPNGLEFSPTGKMYVTDNQGDWMPACPLYHVRPGKFYGHPAPLDWTPEYRNAGRLVTDTDPVAWEREPAAVWFPYDLVRSAAGMAWDRTGGRFGPFEGQLFVAELTNGLIMRTLLEEVRGQMQGATIVLRRNVGCANRVVFAPDGTLFVGLTERGWGGTGKPYGISRVRYRGKLPLEIANVHLVPGGFRVDFTRVLGANLLASQVKVKQYDYSWWWKYGSPETNETEVTVTKVVLSDDRKTLVISAPDLRPGMMARVVFEGVVGKDSVPLLHPRFDYTINQLQDGPLTRKHVANAVPPPPTREQELEGWINISDGYTMDGWSGEGWQPGNISLPDTEATRFKVTEGAHVYVNPNAGDDKTTDLTWKYHHGDIKAKVEFNLPRGGASGVLFMGRYEIILDDTHGAAGEGAAPCGRIAIPHRTEPDWEVPFPKKNVCKKPGEWQMLEVTFRAPRFDATGAKIEDAVFESVVLNDETLYENLKVTGPLLGSAFPAEAPLGPFIIRGTRGQCAYRMVRIRPADWDKREGSGWRPLFGAKGLDDWKPAGWAAWNLEKGSLTGSGERGYLFSPALIESGQALSFLEIRAQVMVSNKGEGSLILGAVFDDRDPAGLRLPLNSNARSKARTGSIQGLANVESHLIPNDIWFQFHARAEAVASGLHIQVRVNGVLVGDVVTTKPLATPLRIALEQVGGGSTIQFREIEYRTAKP